MASPEESFAACLQELIKAGTAQKATPSILVDMIKDHGAIGAAKRLLSAPNPQVGLDRLARIGLLDMSVEACVVKPEHRGLFSAEELAEATRRLDEGRRSAIKKDKPA